MTEMDDLVEAITPGIELIVQCPFKRYYLKGAAVPPKCFSCDGLGKYLIEGDETECKQHPLYKRTPIKLP